MKRYLLGTTAFVATSMMASSAVAQSLEDRVRTLEESMLMGAPGAGFDITVSGFMQGGVFIQDTDTTSYTRTVTYTRNLGADNRIGGIGENRDTFEGNETITPDQDYAAVDVKMGGAEVIFSATSQLNNGIRIGGVVQLEGFTERDQIDETYVWLEGRFGRLVLGAENDASSLLHYSSPWLALNGVDGGSYRYTGPAAVRTGTGTDLAGDANKITYFTPRIRGLQFGISYTPDNEKRGGEANGSGARDTNKRTAAENIIGIGGNFNRAFGSLRVGVSAGWERGSVDFYYGEIVRYFSRADIDVSYEPTNWHIGGFLRMQGVSIGGAYFRSKGITGHTGTYPLHRVEQFNHDRVAVDNGFWIYDFSDRLEQTAWTIGARYTTGPFGIGIGYFQADGRGYPPDGVQTISAIGRNQISPSVEPKTSVVGATVYYRLSRGVTIAADIGVYRDDDDKDNIDSVDEAVGGGIILGISF